MAYTRMTQAQCLAARSAVLGSLDRGPEPRFARPPAPPYTYDRMWRRFVLRGRFVFRTRAEVRGSRVDGRRRAGPAAVARVRRVGLPSRPVVPVRRGRCHRTLPGAAAPRRGSSEPGPQAVAARTRIPGCSRNSSARPGTLLVDARSARGRDGERCGRGPGPVSGRGIHRPSALFRDHRVPVSGPRAGFRIAISGL